LVTAEAAGYLLRAPVPQEQNVLLRSPAGQPLAIGTVSKGDPLGRKDFPTGCDVDDARATRAMSAGLGVPGRHGDRGPVWTDRDGIYEFARHRNFPAQPGGGNVPDQQTRFLVSGGDQPGSVGAESQGPDDAGVREFRARFPAGRIPKAYPVVPTPRSD